MYDHFRVLGIYSMISKALWHNSLITISIFREFRTQTIHQSYNLFVNYLDEDIPAMFRGILHTGSVENCNEIFSEFLLGYLILHISNFLIERSCIKILISVIHPKLSVFPPLWLIK